MQPSSRCGHRARLLCKNRLVTHCVLGVSRSLQIWRQGNVAPRIRIERALESLKALGGGMQVLHHDVRAYAWPLLRLSYPNPKQPARPRDVALYVDRTGTMRAFGE